MFVLYFLSLIAVASATTCNPASSIIGHCVDRINPQTGVSDCPARAQYCNDATYYTLMTEQCPRTCNRCTGTNTATNCADLINPATGTSDCPGMKSYCTNTIYLTLMKTQCPLTCAYCTG